LKNILNILTVCLRVFFYARLAESTLTYPQSFPASRDELGEKSGLEQRIFLGGTDSLLRH
jgi:hypothetical protein